MSKNRHDMLTLLRYQTNYNIVLEVSCKYIRCPCPIVCLSVCVVNMYCIRVQCIPLSVSVPLSVCVVCTVSLFNLSQGMDSFSQGSQRQMLFKGLFYRCK